VIGRCVPRKDGTFAKTHWLRRGIGALIVDHIDLRLGIVCLTYGFEGFRYRSSSNLGKRPVLSQDWFKKIFAGAKMALFDKLNIIGRV